MMKILFKLILFLLLLLAVAVFVVLKNPMLVLERVPGLRVESADLAFKPVRIKLSQVSYVCDAFGAEAAEAAVQVFPGTLDEVKRKVPEAWRFKVGLKDAFITLGESSGEEKEEEARDWEQTVRLPFLFSAEFTNVSLRSASLKMEFNLSGCCANAYEGNHYTLTGAFDVAMSGYPVEHIRKTNFRLLGGLKGNVLEFSLTGDPGQEFFSLANVTPEELTVDRVKAKLDFNSRLDWKLLRSAKASEVPNALTNAYLDFAMRVREARAVSQKVILTNVTMRSEVKTENFLRDKEQYSTLPSWLFHSFKGGLECACSGITITNMAPNVITFREAKAVAYMKKSGLVLSNLYINTLSGQLSGWAEATSRKVQGENYYLPYFELELKSRDIDVGLFCDIFNLKENRMDGKVSGELHTALFGKYVKVLKGKLYANDKGTFSLGQAETYLKGMEAGTSKDLVGILASRLKKYPYKTASIELGYQNKVTTVTFDLEGANDNSHIKLPVHIHSSWLEILDLAKQFQ